MRPVNKQQIAQYNNADYDVLRTYLLEQLGSYCSYCEAPISNDSAVEHKVPQSANRGFPAYNTQWRNLLVACQSCNSAKSASPDKNNVGNPGTSEQWYLATLNSWVWPDRNPVMGNQTAPPVDEIYRLLTISYANLSQNQLIALNAVRASSVQTTKTWATTQYQRAWVLPNTTYIGGNGVLLARVQTMLQGLNLNLYDSSSLTFNNRRVNNRTAAYQAAQAALIRLQAVVNANGGNIAHASVVLMIQAIRQSIIATGFWTTWFTILRAALDNPANGTYWHGVSQANRKNLLTYLLIYYIPAERSGRATDLIFPGTDYNRLNMGAFV